MTTGCRSCAESSTALNCFTIAWMGTFYMVPFILDDCMESYYFRGKIIRESQQNTI